MNTVTLAKEHSTKLINDKARMGAKLETLQTDVNKYLADQIDTAAILKQEEKDFIRDEATADDLAKARSALNKASENLSAAERLEQLATEELQRIERDIVEANKNIQSARHDFCINEKSIILAELNSDKKIRTRLLEAYAAYLSNGLGYNSDWRLFVISIFAQPDQSEINEAIAKFCSKHDLDQ